VAEGDDVVAGEEDCLRLEWRLREECAEVEREWRREEDLDFLEEE